MKHSDINLIQKTLGTVSQNIFPTLTIASETTTFPKGIQVDTMCTFLHTVKKFTKAQIHKSRQ